MARAVLTSSWVNPLRSLTMTLNGSASAVLERTTAVVNAKMYFMDVSSLNEDVPAPPLAGGRYL
jgi:hypothetical protein